VAGLINTELKVPLIVVCPDFWPASMKSPSAWMAFSPAIR
jgi:hypothetical protein